MKKIIFLIILLSYFILTNDASSMETTCDSCSDCSSKLNGSYEKVILTKDISISTGNCIIINSSDVIFDCDGHAIDGNETADAGISNAGFDNVTVENCGVSRFSGGIWLLNVDNNNLLNNSVTYTGYGVTLENVSNSSLKNNTVRNSMYHGILLAGSNNNEISSNEVCGTVENDIVVISSTGNSGTDNTCDKVEGWNDTGETGCTNACTICSDFDMDTICDDVDNCRFVKNTTQIDADHDCDELMKDATYWDGTRWLQDPHCGDECDNCKFVSNPYQQDNDWDQVGNTCDNCWDKDNKYQEDYDEDCVELMKHSRYWDGKKWKQDPHCGNACDNCFMVSNPFQENDDNDFDGNACDNCWYEDNQSQSDSEFDCEELKRDFQYWDGEKWKKDPHCGDACDNCWKRINPYQEDNDQDGWGDACDNCWDKENNDQKDSDLDCKDNMQNPPAPFFKDPHCGDACDNCPSHRNYNQEDWDGDDVGDACDCDDKLMGENEEGSDCGGICSTVCSQKCIPILKQGSYSGKLDIIFIGTPAYSSMDDFRDTVREEAIFGALFDDNLISANKNKFNFWYWTKPISFSAPGQNDPCQWTEPIKWKEDCPHGDAVVILHHGGCRDSTSKEGTSSADFNCARTLVHEIGHSVFGLKDEYADCGTSITNCSGQFCNIYDSGVHCKGEFPFINQGSLNPSNCQQFVNCNNMSWWTSQPQYTIMAEYCGAGFNKCGLCTWGPDGERVVKEELKKYIDPPEDDWRKALIGYFYYNGEYFDMYDSTIVYGGSPDRLLEWDKFRMVYLDSKGNIVNEYTIGDPREAEYFDPLERVRLNEVIFSQATPVLDNMVTLQVYDIETDTLIASVDLSDAVINFCNEHRDDPQCITYDLDGDGVPYNEDLCPETSIPEKLVPSVKLGINQFAIVEGKNNDDGFAIFDTDSPKGEGPDKTFTTEDTKGCSCEQMLTWFKDTFEFERQGHWRYGCSISLIENFIEMND